MSLNPQTTCIDWDRKSKIKVHIVMMELTNAANKDRADHTILCLEETDLRPPFCSFESQQIKEQNKYQTCPRKKKSCQNKVLGCSNSKILPSVLLSIVCYPSSRHISCEHNLPKLSNGLRVHFLTNPIPIWQWNQAMCIYICAWYLKPEKIKTEVKIMES